VEPNLPSVLERMTEILSLLRDTWSLLFSSLAGGERRRADVVVTLLAVLELVRQGRIRAQQTELFGEIVLERSQSHGGSETDPPSPPTLRARNESGPSASAERLGVE
jgi:segregation and condensation protein A